MEYFISIVDSSGFTHSIDNCILLYTLYNKNRIDELMKKLHELKEKYKLENEYWERLGCLPCSRYSWFLNHVHLCDGIYLSFGQYNALNIKDEKLIVPIVKLEINLNKHWKKPSYLELNEWLIDNAGEITLDKYDYAIDIPVNIKDVKVFGSNKERGLYKGTRYFGQRNKHGYCKIYDKQKEQGLDYPLTRVEHTVKPNTNKYKNISLENIYIKSKNEKLNNKMTNTDKCILSMIKSLETYGEDINGYLDILEYRKQKKIIELLRGFEYKKLDYDDKIISDLLSSVRDLTKYQEIKTKVFEDKNGFMKVVDIDLPFE